MDIRNARIPAGTKVSPIQTAEHASTPPTPTVNEDGTLNAVPTELLGRGAMLQYWELLKENGITESDLIELLDSLLTTGNVEWSFKLYDRIGVKLRVRPAWVDDLIIERLDEATQYAAKVSSLRYNNFIAEMNLASSLTQFGDKTFSVSTKEDLDKSIEFVRGLTYVFRNDLVSKLALFDRAIAVATSEWGLKNFLKPLPVV